MLRSLLSKKPLRQKKSFSLNSKVHRGIGAIARISNCCVAGEAFAVRRLRVSQLRLPAAPCTSLLWLAAVGGATKEIEPLAASRNDNARLQAIRALSRFGSPGATCSILEKALADPNLQVAHAALIGLFDHCGDFSREPVFGLAESGDSFLRQT